jgi:hypothetical protein
MEELQSLLSELPAELSTGGKHYLFMIYKTLDVMGDKGLYGAGYFEDDINMNIGFHKPLFRFEHTELIVSLRKLLRYLKDGEEL